MGGGGCRTSPTHDFQPPRRIEFRPTPAATAEPKSRAVALDCEMAGIADGGSEVILLCAVDFLTGAVLINRLVCPGVPITDMRTGIHGITKSSLDTSTSQGQALAGWEAARSELWKYIDDKTILVGHALEHDLDGLRMIHHRVVDSSILSANTFDGRRVRYGLDKLSSELPKIEIRKGNGGIHDCMEDVLAAREVVLFCIRTHNKQAFKSWVQAKKREKILFEAQRKAAKQKKANQNRATGGSSYKNVDSDDLERWSDIAEDLGWPHPDTGYDPWSD